MVFLSVEERRCTGSGLGVSNDGKDANINDLVERLKQKRYRAKLVRREYIPKALGRYRPLGIPVIEDKIVQLAVAKILSAIYEQDFLECSYGYREGIGPHNAVQDLTLDLQYGSFGWIVEVDIKGFFENMDHEWMIRMIEERVDDRAFVNLIRKWLKAGILEKDGRVVHPATGTPQGGIVSPVLSNIYLHYALDLWFEKQFGPRCRGKVRLTRYCDDFVVAFQYKREADMLYRQLVSRLGKFGLQVAEEKTRIIRFSRFKLIDNEGFDFLGFEFRWGMNSKGKPQVKRRTSRKKFRASIANFTSWIKESRNQKISKLFNTLASKYRGYWNYYGIRGNSSSLKALYYQTMGILYKWLNRRSQRKSYNWKGFMELVRHFRIPYPRITERPRTGKFRFA